MDVKLILAIVLGVFAHYVKKCAKDDHSWKEYWVGHKYNTILSLIGAVVGYLMLSEMGQSDLLSYFLVGYTCDSVLNKSEKFNKL